MAATIPTDDGAPADASSQLIGGPRSSDRERSTGDQRREGTPLAALARGYARLVRLRGGRDPVWRQVLMIGWLCWLYDLLTELAPTRRALAFAHAHTMLSFERSLGLSPELALNRWLSRQHTLALVLSDYYDNAHFIVTLGLVGWLWWRHSDVFVPLRNALVLMNVIAFAVFLLYPVAPPRLLTGEGFTDIVVATHAIGSSLHTGSLSHDADQYAAMPSLHIAWATWCAVVLWQTSKRRLVRALGFVHVALTAFIVLSTGNHFLLDVLGGFVTAALSFAIVAAFERVRGRSRPPRAPGAADRLPEAAPSVA